MMHAKSVRELVVEAVESRLVLSASTCAEVCFSSADQEFVESDGISEHAFLAADNDVETARDLGVLDELLSVEGDFVGLFDDRDVFRFELESRADVRVDLYDLSADADLYLLDIDELVLARSSNWGYDAEALDVSLEPATYFLVVESYDFDRSTGYELDIRANRNLIPDNVGNTFDDALLIEDLGVPLDEYVGPNDLSDVYEFQLEEKSNVVIELKEVEEDLDLYLFAGTREQLDQAETFGAVDERLDVELDAGSYFVAVEPFGAVGSTYQLGFHVSLWEPPPEPDPVEDPDSSGPTIEPLADVDYFGGSRDWGLNFVYAPEAWEAGYTGEGVTVAVIDSGVEIEHPDLADNIWINADETPGDGIDNDRNGFIDDYRGWDFYDDDNVLYDGSNHGSHVAGIIAAANNEIGNTGVAWGARVMPIRVLDRYGSGNTYDVARGIRYAVDNGAQIVNLSLGGGRSSSIVSAIRYALDHDVLVIAAAGNEGAGVPGYPGYDSGELDNLLSVGAYNRSQRLASFSNRVGSSDAIQVDAPGTSIYSAFANGSYGFLSGTSMSSPFVAGVAALTLSANPDLTAVELREALTRGAVEQVDGSDSIGGVNVAHSIPWALSSVTVSAASSPVLYIDWDEGHSQHAADADLVTPSGRDIVLETMPPLADLVDHLEVALLLLNARDEGMRKDGDPIDVAITEMDELVAPLTL